MKLINNLKKYLKLSKAKNNEINSKETTEESCEMISRQFSEEEEVNSVIKEVNEKCNILRNRLINELRKSLDKALIELDLNIGLDELHGFAIGTGNFFDYFRAMACSKRWVENDMKYEFSRSVFVDWPYYIEFTIFDEVINILSELQSVKDQMMEELDIIWMQTNTCLKRMILLLIQ